MRDVLEFLYRENMLILRYISVIIVLGFFQCSLLFPKESKTISGRVIDNVTKIGIPQIIVKIEEYEGSLMDMGGGTHLGTASQSISDSNGYFSSKFFPNEDATQWLLIFNSINQDDSLPIYSDNHWYQINSEIYELTQLNNKN